MWFNVYLAVFFKWEIQSWIKERMLNGSIALSFQFTVVAGTFNIVINTFLCHGIIMSPLVVEDYILKRGGKNVF